MSPPARSSAQLVRAAAARTRLGVAVIARSEVVPYAARGFGNVFRVNPRSGSPLPMEMNAAQ